MFRYSGSKKRLIKYLPPPPTNTHTIIEPFAGSAAYGMHYRPKNLLLCEANTDVAALWEWLIKDATPEYLRGLQALLLRKKEEGQKFNLADLRLPKGPETLARLTTSGVYVGQLSSWVFYPQHKANFEPLIATLPYIKASVRVIANDFSYMAIEDRDGVMYFIDPPYLGTSANYIDKTCKIDVEKTDLRLTLTGMVKKMSQPVLFTYGDGAQDVFPKFDWKLAVQRKVPKIRTGGTKIRNEYYARIRY